MPSALKLPYNSPRALYYDLNDNASINFEIKKTLSIKIKKQLKIYKLIFQYYFLDTTIAPTKLL